MVVALLVRSIADIRAQMKDVHGGDGRAAVYSILRVFEIESDRIGICVYLYPEQLRLDGRLASTGETWSVVLGIGPIHED